MTMESKLGLCSISFRESSPEEILRAMQKAGLWVIEWGSDVHAPKDEPEKLRQLVRLQEQYRISCCSYGTYFRIGRDDPAELEAYIVAAKLLRTNILRLWCGTKNSEQYTEEEKQQLFAQCRQVAKLAEEAEVTVCMECHGNSYTNRGAAAYELMQAVGSPNFRMYWQPNQARTLEENLDSAKLLAPYIENIHVFNWTKTEKFPLAQAKEVWKTYLSYFAAGKTLLLEFMPDGQLASLEAEAEALKEIAK